jgi:hypothetical protein
MFHGPGLRAVIFPWEGKSKYMSIFKRGKVYWYHFMFNGEHIQKSTKQGNPRIARHIEAAYKTALAKGEVGIIERKKIAGFQDAMEDFLTWSKQENQMASSSAERYHYSSLALLKFFGDKRLDKITPEKSSVIRSRARRNSRR